MRIKIITFLVAAITGCGNINDYSENLGDGYTFVHSGGNSRYIRPDNIYKNAVVYSDVIDFVYDDSYVIVAQNPNRESHKTSLAADLGAKYQTYLNSISDPTFLITEKSEHLESLILKDSIIYNSFLEKGISPNNTRADQIIMEGIADSILTNDESYKGIFHRNVNYWIISKANDILYGPYSWREMESKRKALEIDIQLEE